MTKKLHNNRRYDFSKVNEYNQDLLASFRNSCIGKKKSETTTYIYCKDIYKFIQYLEDNNINTIETTTDDILKYINLVESKGIGANKILKILTALSKFFDLLVDRKKLMKVNPIYKIDRERWRAVIKAEKLIK